MNKFKRLAALLLCAAMLSGCTILSSDEDLLQAPRPPKNYQMLQKTLDGLKGNQTQVSPEAGDYRSAVTFQDMDGDGEDEAVAVLRQGKSGQISVYVFRNDGSAYEQIGCVKGQGSSVYSLDFPQIGENTKGLIINWSMNSGSSLGMTICGMDDGEMESTAELEYTEYTSQDVDSDGADELFVLNYNDKQRVAQLYDYRGGEFRMAAQADATTDVQTPANILISTLADGTPAAYVDNKFENDNGMQTDIYAITGKGTKADPLEMENLALSSEISTYRSVSLYYSTDVDSDGVVEVPQITPAPGYEESAPQDTLWLEHWYRFGIKKGSGQKEICTAYQSGSENWRLIFPKKWDDFVTVETLADESGVSRTIFRDRDTGEVLAEVATFSGAEREANLSKTDMVRLGSYLSNTYGFRVHDDVVTDRKIRARSLRDRFTIVKSNWY